MPLEELAGGDGTHTVLLLVGRKEENIILPCKPIVRLISEVLFPVWQDGESSSTKEKQQDPDLPQLSWVSHPVKGVRLCLTQPQEKHQ